MPYIVSQLSLLITSQVLQVRYYIELLHETFSIEDANRKLRQHI